MPLSYQGGLVAAGRLVTNLVTAELSMAAVNDFERGGLSRSAAAGAGEFHQLAAEIDGDRARP
jgi:hypothetical protein